jgi:hypothetical protein
VCSRHFSSIEIPIVTVWDFPRYVYFLSTGTTTSSGAGALGGSSREHEHTETAEETSLLGLPEVLSIAQSDERDAWCDRPPKNRNGRH